MCVCVCVCVCKIIYITQQIKDRKYLMQEGHVHIKVKINQSNDKRRVNGMSKIFVSLMKSASHSLVI